MRLLKPFLEKKKRLGLDKWGRDDTHVGHIYEPIIKHMQAEIPEEFLNKRYPHHWGLKGHVNNVIRELLFSEILAWEYASYFEGKTLQELDELAASFKVSFERFLSSDSIQTTLTMYECTFKLENCVRRDGLNEILRQDAGMH